MSWWIRAAFGSNKRDHYNIRQVASILWLTDLDLLLKIRLNLLIALLHDQKTSLHNQDMWFDYISLSVDHSAHALEVCCLWHSSGGGNSAKSTICIYRLSRPELSWKSQGCDILSSSSTTGKFKIIELKLTVISTITTIRNPHKNWGQYGRLRSNLPSEVRLAKFSKQNRLTSAQHLDMLSQVFLPSMAKVEFPVV